MCKLKREGELRARARGVRPCCAEIHRALTTHYTDPTPALNTEDRAFHHAKTGNERALSFEKAREEAEHHQRCPEQRRETRGPERSLHRAILGGETRPVLPRELLPVSDRFFVGGWI